MAARRSSIILTRHFSSLINYHLPKTLETLESLNPIISCYSPLPDSPLHPFQELKTPSLQWHGFSTLTRRRGVTSGKEDVYEEEDGHDDDEDDEDFDDEEEDEEENQSVWDVGEGNEKVEPFKAEEADAIGYKVIGRLGPSDLPLKDREPIFAVVKVGSHQFKVSNEDCIYTERLKWCEVNDKLILSSVLMLGSETQTMIGRPTLPDAEVHAVVEEHVLDAKVIIFKKKRRKNYRRTKGHRQELTRLRIIDIRGIEMPCAAAASS